MRLVLLAVVALAIGSSAGCGTVHNLLAPPEFASRPANVLRPEDDLRLECVPFGGLLRSYVLGTYGTVVGPLATIEGGLDLVRGNGIFPNGDTRMANGLWLTGCGLGAFVDTPLSLAGDVATLPIAYARSNHHPWATWWGVEADGQCPFWRLGPTPPNYEQKTEQQLETPR